MDAVSKLIVAGCLVCAAPLVQACDVRHEGEYGGKFFQEMDKNGDGAVSKKEFDAFHNAHFKEVDANKDGKITQDEMEALHQKMHERGQERFKKHFEESDTNHDGALSKEEAEAGMPMVFKHFDEIDANKDGKVSKEELADSMKKMHEQMQEKGRSQGIMKRGQP